MAQIFDVPTVPGQRSMTGDVLDPNAPGKYYDEADMARREASSAIRGQISANPAVDWPFYMGKRTPEKLKQSDAWRVMHLPGGDEGSIAVFAQKYGLELTKSILEAMPKMTKEQLQQVSKMMQSAISDASGSDERERMAYERAGMQYRQGQYVPK